MVGLQIDAEQRVHGVRGPAGRHPRTGQQAKKIKVKVKALIIFTLLKKLKINTFIVETRKLLYRYKFNIFNIKYILLYFLFYC